MSMVRGKPVIEISAYSSPRGSGITGSEMACLAFVVPGTFKVLMIFDQMSTQSKEGPVTLAKEG